jgi:hypothetical protein
MSVEFETYLCDYIKSRIGVYEKWVLAALNNEDGCIQFLDCSEGVFARSLELKNCELLRDAGLFTEEIKLSRHGRSSYRLFHLTDVGKQFAEALKQRSVFDRSDR